MCLKALKPWCDVWGFNCRVVLVPRTWYPDIGTNTTALTTWYQTLGWVLLGTTLGTKITWHSYLGVKLLLKTTCWRLFESKNTIPIEFVPNPGMTQNERAHDEARQKTVWSRMFWQAQAWHVKQWAHGVSICLQPPYLSCMFINNSWSKSNSLS